MAEREGGRTKWWWLGFVGVQSWTAEERRARIVLSMAWLASCVVSLLIADLILEWLGVEHHAAAALAALMSVALGFAAARPIATELYPEILKKGDENAAMRLSGLSKGE